MLKQKNKAMLNTVSPFKTRVVRQSHISFTPPQCVVVCDLKVHDERQAKLTSPIKISHKAAASSVVKLIFKKQKKWQLADRHPVVGFYNIEP